MTIELDDDVNDDVKFFQNFGLYYRAVFPHKKKLHHHPPFFARLRLSTSSLPVGVCRGWYPPHPACSSLASRAYLSPCAWSTAFGSPEYSTVWPPPPFPFLQRLRLLPKRRLNRRLNRRPKERRWSFPRKSARSSTCVSLWSSWSSSAALLLFVF